MNLTQYKPRLLEAPAGDMFEIFDKKVASTGANGLVDYVGLSVQLLDDQIERLKIAKKEIDALIKSASGQQEIIKIEFAKFLTNNGVASLEGDNISSIKVTEKAPAKKLIIEDETKLIDAGFTKTVLDEKLIASTIEAGEEVEGARIEITHFEERVTIYKRKGQQ